MKRSEIESKVTNVRSDVTKRIENAPVPAFVVGLLSGIVIALSSRVVVPLVVIAALGGWAYWLLADRDDSEVSAKPEEKKTEEKKVEAKSDKTTAKKKEKAASKEEQTEEAVKEAVKTAPKVNGKASKAEAKQPAAE